MEALGCLAAVVLLSGPVILIILAVELRKLKSQVRRLSARVDEFAPQPTVAPLPVAPQPAPGAVVAASTAPKTTLPRPPINWESVVGVKLFAWIGGLAFFLGVVFFVKYAFENNLITPAMRITIGAIVGVLLIIAGVFTATRRYRVPGQSLCATGILVLYADTFAAHALYDLISLSAASALMCIVTAGALALAFRLDAQSVVWLAAFGGYLTPTLLWTQRDNPAALFTYIAVLNFGLAAVAAMKRWNYFVLLAAFGTIAIEFAWAADFFGASTAEAGRRILLLMAAQFLIITIAREKTEPRENFSAIATAMVGLFAVLFCGGAAIEQHKFGADFVYPILFFADAILLAIAAVRIGRAGADWIAAVISGFALAFTWAAEWGWHERMFDSANPIFGIVWYVAIFLLFASAPLFCGSKRSWPWIIATASGALQFWFAYELCVTRFPSRLMFLLPVGFAIPYVIGLLYLMRREHVPAASGDSRLATAATGLLLFLSLVVPVEFNREWITLGWAIEGVALVLLYRRVPNQQLRIAATVVLCAAFARLAFNPAIFEYHKRAPYRIWNWYLYAYGITTACEFAAARIFGARSRWHERIAPPLLYALGTILLFLLLNIEIADYFSLGPTLTFSFSGDFARDMTYTIAWALFAFALLLIGIFKATRAVRIAAIALLGITLAKLFLHDLDQLAQLYRIAAFLSVAVIAIIASFAYQRFLAPKSTASR
jgi:uncharacterized membrane protein